ncbi:homocysteine S-methyltransferase [Sarracenia purpurea var. burkii]
MLVFETQACVELLEEENIRIPSWISFSSVDDENAPSEMSPFRRASRPGMVRRGRSGLTQVRSVAVPAINPICGFLRFCKFCKSNLPLRTDSKSPRMCGDAAAMTIDALIGEKRGGRTTVLWSPEMEALGCLSDAIVNVWQGFGNPSLVVHEDERGDSHLGFYFFL